jgi:hypothetical protein
MIWPVYCKVSPFSLSACSPAAFIRDPFFLLFLVSFSYFMTVQPACFLMNCQPEAESPPSPPTQRDAADMAERAAMAMAAARKKKGLDDGPLAGRETRKGCCPPARFLGCRRRRTAAWSIRKEKDLGKKELCDAAACSSGHLTYDGAACYLRTWEKFGRRRRQQWSVSQSVSEAFSSCCWKEEK